jgi:hypothetical protein
MEKTLKILNSDLFSDQFFSQCRMVPDQTIRVMENKFDICDGHIQFFPTFPMEIFDRFEVFRYIPFTQDGNPQRFEVFRLHFHCKGWKSPTFRRFPIIFTFQRMEIPDDSKFSAYIPYQRMEITEFYGKKDYKQ